MRINLETDEQPEIGLVALIDCIFFLLMFFMVATSFKQQADRKEKTLDIVLPTSSVTLDKAATANEALVIVVDADGKFSIGNQPFSAQSLTLRLRKERTARPALRVQIDGDRRTSYQHIVHALDLCQFEGITGISLRVRN